MTIPNILTALASLIALSPLVVTPASARISGTASIGGLAIDILVPVQTTDEADRNNSCSADKVPTTTGVDIVVCGEPGDHSAYYYSGSRDAAQDRYAQETAFAGSPPTPDVSGAGIFKGPATIGGLCGFMFNPCPGPKAYLIDFSTLPDAPAGSDANLIAKGLAPAGLGSPAPRTLSEFEKKELGLPPALFPVPINRE